MFGFGGPSNYSRWSRRRLRERAGRL